MSIYRSYTHDLRAGDKALKEDGLKPKEHNLMLMNALENLMCGHSELIELIEGKGFEFSHGADGRIKDFYKAKTK